MFIHCIATASAETTTTIVDSSEHLLHVSMDKTIMKVNLKAEANARQIFALVFLYAKWSVQRMLMPNLPHCLLTISSQFLNI